MLRYETITREQKAVLELLSERGFFERFYLAGGTGLSLQIGHRKSVDLDLFSADEFEPQEIIILLKETLRQELVKKNTLIGEVRGVRASFFYFPYITLDDFIVEDKIKIAGLKDIAAMKVNAIISRGSKKDFIDLYAILRQARIGIKGLLDKCENKFPGFERLIALKALCYFDDAEKETLTLPLFIDTRWDEVKEYFNKEAQGAL